mmetsp:Transcript_15116/g.22266  ORF Transcript_15116/g.22266 Transcript_15116/m.22266 type:complete len:160 (-) Transcript_15116:72-551(-)
MFVRRRDDYSPKQIHEGSGSWIDAVSTTSSFAADDVAARRADVDDILESGGAAERHEAKRPEENEENNDGGNCASSKLVLNHSLDVVVAHGAVHGHGAGRRHDLRLADNHNLLLDLVLLLNGVRLRLLSRVSLGLNWLRLSIHGLCLRLDRLCLCFLRF